MAAEIPACPELSPEPSPEPSRRIAANRANAQHSTGPKTPEGKARVARNALRHGLRARLIIDNPVDRGDGSRFGALLADLVAELSPVGVLEEFAVETIAVCVWRLRHSVQEELNGAGMTERDIYFAQMDKAWEETGNKEGYPPPKRDDPALASDQRIILLIRYEAHLYRQYYRALGNLQALQAARLAQAAHDDDPFTSTPAPAGDQHSSPCPSAPPATAPAASPSANLAHFGGIFPFAETFCQTKPISKKIDVRPLALIAPRTLLVGGYPRSASLLPVATCT